MLPESSATLKLKGAQVVKVGGASSFAWAQTAIGSGYFPLALWINLP